MRLPRFSITSCLKKTALVFGSTLLFLTLLNLIYIAFFNKGSDPSSQNNPSVSFHRRSELPGIHHEHIPGIKVFDHGVDISINSYGFRDHEFSTRKPEGNYRVVVLGDSITFGQGVRLEDTFPKQLEQSLNKGGDGNSRFQVLNAGVQGYNTVEELAMLRHRVLPLAPDFLIIGFCEPNDPEIETVAPFPIRNALGRASIFLRLPLFEYLSNRLETRIVSDLWTKHTRAIYRPDGKPWKECRNALEEMRDICRENHIDLLVVLIPVLCPVDYYKPERDQLKATLTALDMPFLETRPIIEDIPEDQLHVSETDHHPSSIVHHLFAESIYNWMKKNLPGRMTPDID